jgi:hypothetical protein
MLALCLMLEQRVDAGTDKRIMRVAADRRFRNKAKAQPRVRSVQYLL